MSDQTNRFTGLRSWCPRCGETVQVEKFIVNVLKESQHIMATYACPNCSDVVQIVVAQESAENVAPRKPKPTKESDPAYNPFGLGK